MTELIDHAGAVLANLMVIGLVGVIAAWLTFCLTDGPKWVWMLTNLSGCDCDECCSTPIPDEE